MWFWRRWTLGFRSSDSREPAVSSSCFDEVAACSCRSATPARWPTPCYAFSVRPQKRERLAMAGREILAREFSFVNYARTLVELVRAERPKVSVIVPNYNYAKYLPARLKSIINQTYPPYEVLFLDDCSTDDSVEIAAEMLHASGLSYRIIANETNQGTYRQWLRGIREAKGDLIWIAEADDDCAPTFLERLVGQFERPDVVLAYCQSRQIDEEGRELAPDYLD